MAETWSKIDGYENYSVSDLGRVRNDKTGEFKAPVLGTRGYYGVDLYKNGERKKCRIHRLVCEAFLDNPENKTQINHIDGDKANNSVENLEYVTPSENMRHAIDTGLCHPGGSMLGKRNPNAGRKGTPVRIVETGEEFNSIRECEAAINGNNRHISDCLNGKQETHRGYHFERI